MLRIFSGLFESLEAIVISTGKSYAATHGVLAYGIGMPLS